MTDQVRLILDPPASGSWNMSVDQALLESAENFGQTIFRVYRWEAPTLSLGYFQKQGDRFHHAASQSCELVRRHSGGGAIIHDHELTYSLCVSSQNRWSRRHEELYDQVHQIIIMLLKDCSVESTLFSSAPDTFDNIYVDRNAFLCFQRRTDGDIICDGYKICGSAQRRQKSSLLQHGSLLLQQSEFAPELPGVNELSGVDVEWEPFAKAFGEQIQQLFGLERADSKLSSREQERAIKIQREKFAHSDWTQRR